MSRPGDPFRRTGERPSSIELVAHVRALLADSTDALEFDAPHFRERLRARGLTMRQVLETLRHGEVVAGPQIDPYGDWRIKMRKSVAGRRVQVVVAVRRTSVIAITAM